MPDFSVLQMPNFAQSALSGYQAGQALGKQRRLDAALAGVDLERPETLLPLLHEAPATGAALIGTSVKLRDENRKQAADLAYAKALRDTASASGQAETSTPPLQAATASTTTPTTAATATDTTPNEIIVNAPRPSRSLQNRVADLVEQGVSMEGAQQFVNVVGSMSEADRKARADAQEQISHAYLDVAGIPLPQRRAWVLAHADELAQHGVPRSTLETMPLDDESLERGYNHALTVKDVLANREHATDNERQDRRLALSETQAAESNRRADARLDKVLAAKPGGGSGTDGYEYRIGPDGKLQRRKR